MEIVEAEIQKKNKKINLEITKNGFKIFWNHFFVIILERTKIAKITKIS